MVGETIVEGEVDSARVGTVASNEDVSALGLAANPGNYPMISESDIGQT